MRRLGRGIRTRFSDDLLWLVYITEEYINFTGNYEILDIETNYLQGASLEEGTDENMINIYHQKKKERYMNIAKRQ